MKATFLSKKEEVPGIKTFMFKPSEPYEYIAGQFAFFNFELNEKSFKKHFTISNGPGQENIEFTTIISESKYKQALDSLEVGHEIELSEPMGEFTLEKNKEKPLAFLQGGIGITPVKSMLEFLADKGVKRDIIIFYSNRTEERIVFREELDELAEKTSAKIVHTLTKLDEKEKKNWAGETGYINKEMIENHLANVTKTFFYIAGPPKFVEAMQKLLTKDVDILTKDVAVENFAGY
ncbi:MAG: hypothetical protein CL943_01825 [Candidatus Diapherotrites archaeon]|uniref:FAD-binding FR-type domain-containing protein n=1 Tax=Candidatus Iainarchaeum sp. TaxID=3101447 RepID=A0A2D6M0U5_9ARCH|nr:hypothetical protein [Candidatus Diapherotrites archaeon]|tara:strand:- start:19982 stop:20686 length:705 start_codon:yes stop_codon:yes gene_type:complete